MGVREWIAEHLLGREPEPTPAELERQAEEQRDVDRAIERQLQGLPPEQLTGLHAWAEEFHAGLHAITAGFDERYGMTVDQYLDRHGAYPPEVAEELQTLNRELDERYPELIEAAGQVERWARAEKTPEWPERLEHVLATYDFWRDLLPDMPTEAEFAVLDGLNDFPLGAAMSDWLETRGHLDRTRGEGLRDLARTPTERAELDARQQEYEAGRQAKFGVLLDEASPADLWATVGRHGEVVRAPETERGWQWWDPGGRASGWARYDAAHDGRGRGGAEHRSGGRGWDPSDVNWTHYWGEPPWASAPLHGNLGPVWTQGGLYEPPLDQEAVADLDVMLDRYLEHHVQDVQRQVFEREAEHAAQRAEEVYAQWRENREGPRPVDEWLAEELEQRMPDPLPRDTVEGSVVAEHPELDIVDAERRDDPESVDLEREEAIQPSWADRWAERQAELPGEPEHDLPPEVADHPEVIPLQLQLEADHDEAEPEDDVQPR
jgi:hypothetical protein